MWGGVCIGLPAILLAVVTNCGVWSYSQGLGSEYSLGHEAGLSKKQGKNKPWVCGLSLYDVNRGPTKQQRL